MMIFVAFILLSLCSSKTYGMSLRHNSVSASNYSPDNGDEVVVEPVDNERSGKRNLDLSAVTWPSSTIPFMFDLSLLPDHRSSIEAAHAEISSKTCLQFQEYNKNNHPAYFIKYTTDTRCFSPIGIQSTSIWSGQDVSLSINCNSKGNAEHEIMHALGFEHEHVRSDRDSYVEIHLDNVLSNYQNMFVKKNTNNHGVPYDFGSIMQYDSKAFAIDKTKPTIKALSGSHPEMGQRNGLSSGDELLINKVYCGA